MSKLELTNYSFTKNSKISRLKLKKLCHFFLEDMTASQTAKELDISRQTINNYYKVIRQTLLKNYEIINDDYFNSINIEKKSITLKYFTIYKEVVYFIEENNKSFIINKNNKRFSKLFKFIESDLKDSLLNHKRANSAKIIYNKRTDRYFVASFFKSSNLIEHYIINRLKKFRGINKNNISIHIEESFLRFNYEQKILLNSLFYFFFDKK